MFDHAAPCTDSTEHLESCSSHFGLERKSVEKRAALNSRSTALRYSERKGTCRSFAFPVTTEKRHARCPLPCSYLSWFRPLPSQRALPWKGSLCQSPAPRHIARVHPRKDRGILTLKTILKTLDCVELCTYKVL